MISNVDVATRNKRSPYALPNKPSYYKKTALSTEDPEQNRIITIKQNGFTLRYGIILWILQKLIHVDDLLRYTVYGYHFFFSEK